MRRCRGLLREVNGEMARQHSARCEDSEVGSCVRGGRLVVTGSTRRCEEDGETGACVRLGRCGWG